MLFPVLQLDLRKQKEEQRGGITMERRKAIHQNSFRGVEAADFKVFVEAILKGSSHPGYNRAKTNDCLELSLPKENAAQDLYTSMIHHEDLR